MNKPLKLVLYFDNTDLNLTKVEQSLYHVNKVLTKYECRIAKTESNDVTALQLYSYEGDGLLFQIDSVLSFIGSNGVDLLPRLIKIDFERR